MPKAKCGIKICAKCRSTKPVKSFGADRFQRDMLKPWCKRCRRLDNQKRYRNKKNTPEFKKFSREKAIALRNKSPQGFLSSLFSSCANRAKRSGIPILINKKMVLELWDRQQGSCYYSGTKMTTTAGSGRIDTNASLERLIPSAGYVPGNVVLCCYYINVSKREKSIDEWLRWSSLVLNFKYQNICQKPTN